MSVPCHILNKHGEDSKNIPNDTTSELRIEMTLLRLFSVHYCSSNPLSFHERHLVALINYTVEIFMNLTWLFI